MAEYDSVDLTGWSENEIAIRENMLGMNGGRDAIVEKIEKVNDSLKITDEWIVKTTKEVKTLNNAISETDRVTAYKDKFEEAYESVNKTRAELNALETELAQMKEYRGMNGLLGNDGLAINVDKDKVDEVIKYLQDKIDTIKLDLRIENQKDWQEALQKAFGFDNKTQAGLLDKWLAGGNGGDWVDSFIEAQKETYNRIARTNSRLGINQNDTGAASSYAKMQIEGLMKVYNELMQDPAKFGVDDSNFGLLDNTVSKIQTHLDSLIKLYEAQGGDMEELNEVLNNTTKEVSDLGDETQKTIYNMKDSLKGYLEQAIQGTDLSNILNKYSETGDIKAALVDTLIKDVVNFLAQNQKLQDVLNIVNGLVEGLAPALQFVANILWLISMPLQLLFTLLNKALSWLFGDFNSMCDDLYNSMKKEKDARDENTKDLTAQYRSLIATMKEQEEYYIHKKAELNAFALENRVNGITPVNDMILTPHGTFSTNPNDTIIATKNPGGLGNGDIRVTVNNYSDSNVDVQQRQNANGMTEMLVTISKKIASDVAGGYNGWDGALAMQKQRVDGRRI